jgi:polyvinyl alcohol dehydrogenase (cytochrome)
MGFQCRTNPPLADPASGPSWNGWSPDLANTRFQPAAVARLTAAQVPRLTLKWAFGFPSGVSANAQPTVASGRVFVGSDNGFVYSIDAKTGCVYWSFETGSIIRNAIVVGAVKGAGDAKYAAYVGDGHANVFAINAQDGKLLWKTRVDPHFVARITAGIRYYDGKVIVRFVLESSAAAIPATPAAPRAAASSRSTPARASRFGRRVIPDEPKPCKRWRTADAVCAGRRRRVELADDRSGEARRLLRHRRRDDGARRRRRRTPSWRSTSIPASSSGRFERPRTTSHGRL